MKKETISVHPLQTKEWSEFRKNWGNEVTETKYGYITLHRIPFLNRRIGIFEKGSTPTSRMLSDLKEFAKKENLIFIKFEPNVKKEEKVVKLLTKAGAVSGKTLFTPTSFWIDLTKSEDELLKSFKSKTRYNIRLAQRHGVTVEEDNSSKAFEEYLRLMKETVQRDQFFAHNEKYHRLMWESLKGNLAHLLVAKYKGEIIISWIVFIYDGFLYYPYGASTDKYKNVMASSLMMWEAIKFGKKHNLRTFDLWGREEGKGFTKFKEGFNPEVVEFLGTWDLVIDKVLYYIYRTMEVIRWIILRIKSNFVKPTF